MNSPVATPLYALLPLLDREVHAQRLVLHRFTAAGVRDLVLSRYALPEADTTRLVTWLLGRAEGNAFFTAQLLRALEDNATLSEVNGGRALGNLDAIGLPTALRQVLDGRLARLGDEAQQLLTLAAIIGHEVPLVVWATVAETDEDGLFDTIERAVDAHLLIETSDGQGVRFAHALIREALYEGTLATRRRRVHRRVGETLATETQADPDAIAYHFQRVGDARAGEWLVRAGERAQRSFSLATAAARYQTAVNLLPDDDAHAADRGRLLARVGNALRYVDPRRSVAAYAEAYDLGERARDRALTALARFDLGMFRSNLGERQQGLTDMMAGIAAMETLSPEELDRPDFRVKAGQPSNLPRRRRSLLGFLAHAGHFADVVALAAEWVDHDVPVDRALVTGHADACHGVGMAHAMLGHPEEAHRWLAEGERGFRVVGHPAMAATLAVMDLWLVLLVATPERLVERERLAQEAVDALTLACEMGAVRIEPREYAIPLWLVAGRWADARAAALAGLELLPNRAAPDIIRGFLGWLARAQGVPDEAWEQVRAVFPEGPQPAPTDAFFPAGPPLLRLGAALALDGNALPEAQQWLAIHDQWLTWSGAQLGLVEGALLWSAYHRTAGDRAQAMDHAEKALAHATEPRQPLALLAAHRLLGELVTEAGHYAEAQAHIEQALALADACAAPYERALTLLALADLHAATSDSTPALLALDEARAICTPLEARPALARADTLAARLAPPPLVSDA